MTPRCVNGHLLEDKNFYVSEKGKKRCRICASSSSKKWKKKNKEKWNKYLREWRKK